MEESRVSITSALTDLLTAELELSEISNDKRQDEPRAPGSTPVDGRADAAQTDFVTGDLDALLDALDVAVLLVANDRTIVLVNKEAELLFELPAAQLVGTRVNPGRFTASLAGRTLKLADGGLIRMAVSTGRQTPQVKLIMHRPDGTQIDLRVWARPVFRRIQDSRIGVAVFLKRFTQLESERGTRARLAALEMAFARLAPLIGGDPTIMQVAPSDLAQLTDRERQVLTLLAAGLRVANVAEELYVSEHTVRNHLKGIFRKLGVSNQAELIRRLRTTGHEFPEDGES
jgi:DNA-binding CsgD family transcriptional regulator/PAS domain-containing protein